MKAFISPLIVTVFLLAFSGCKPQLKKPVHWEYKVVTSRLEIDELDELGKKGWELVSITGATFPASPVAYFKRPIP